MKYQLTRSSLLALLIVGLIFPLAAQEISVLTITDPGELYSTFDFSTADKDAVIAAVGIDRFEAINLSCHENQWPSGIANLDSRNENRDKIKQYHITLVTTLGEKSIVEINSVDNNHMPADMLAPSSFYFVIGSGGLSSGEGIPGKSGNEDDFSIFEDEFPQVEIIDPGQLLSGYTFSEEEMQEISDQIGEDGYEYVNSNCREESWPKGINNLENRLANREDIKLYNAFLVAETGDISILEVTPEENMQMPVLLQPVTTFYFIIKSAGIELLQGE
jgi:hypothetical protein